MDSRNEKVYDIARSTLLDTIFITTIPLILSDGAPMDAIQPSN